MVTDSGRFRYDSVNTRTFALAAFLMSVDFSTADIYRELYADELDMIKLRARFTLKINRAKNGVAYIYTTAEEAEETGADTFTISRGMVGTMSDIRGINSWVNFTETSAGVLCELRSAKYNINPIAVKYGGGGHAKASGATVPDRETAMKMLKSKLIEIAEREQKEKIEDLKGVQMEIGWGSHIRSYVFHPYTMVKDHRTNYEVGNINAVMDGDIDGFINAYLKMQSQEKLAAENNQ